MSHSDRRKLVNLSVFAVSAAMFAAAWVGVVGADQAAGDGPVDFAAVPVTGVTTRTPTVIPFGTTRTVPAVASQSSTGTTTVAPVATQAPATRQVVVVRRSRPS